MGLRRDFQPLTKVKEIRQELDRRNRRMASRSDCLIHPFQTYTGVAISFLEPYAIFGRYQINIVEQMPMSQMALIHSLQSRWVVRESHTAAANKTG